MGGRSLSGYLFRQENGVSESMSLAQAMEQYVRGSSPPVLVVDGSVIVYWIYEGLDWLCQGQWRESASKVQQFVDLIRNAGIEPIFCFDGGVIPYVSLAVSATSSKHEVWLERRRSDLRKVRGVFDALNAGTDPCQDKDLSLLPPSLTAETSLLLKYQCSVEVYQSTLDGDLEIALLARQLGLNKCVGILSRDTDFLIYNTAGVPLLLLDGQSPFSNPKVYRCNQNVFASNLGLTIDQLPLLACLLGNDSFPLEVVKPFHATLPRITYGNWFTNLLSSVSNVIRPYHRGNSLVELEIRVFGANRCKLNEGAGVYYKALENVPREETGLFRDIVESKRLRLITAEMNPKLEEYFPTGIEYPRFTRLPPAVSVFRPVRQRYLSMVGKSCVKVFSLYLEGSADGGGQMLQTVPIGVTVQHLHQPNVPDAVKWKTFAQLWQFPEWLLEWVKTLPETLQAITMALRLVWVQSGCDSSTKLETWEMEAVVRHCYLLHLNKGVMTCEPGLPLPRGVHLGLLVARIFTNLTRTVLACNFPVKLESVMPWNVFDGKVMQYHYKQMSKGEKFEPLSRTEQLIMQLICQ